MAKNCIALTNFDSSFSPCISDQVVHHVLIYCEGLTSLLLAGCKLLTAQCLHYLWLHGNSLTEADFSQCDIPTKEFNIVFKMLPHIKIKGHGTD